MRSSLFVHRSLIGRSGQVAGSTTSRHRTVTHGSGQPVGRACMALGAFVTDASGWRCGRHMIGDLLGNAGICSPVAGLTRGADAGMIEDDRGAHQPVRSDVAGVTCRCGRNMRRWFGRNVRISGGMTCRAGPGRDSRMAKRGDQRQPPGGAMADIAGLGRRDMHGWLRNGDSPVVTGRANAGRRAMREIAWLPGRCGVADVALLGGRQVRRRLLQGVGGHIGATVTGRAIGSGHRTGGPGMGHHRRRKGSKYLVTGIALR